MSERPLAERLQVKNGRLLAVVGATPGLEASLAAPGGRAHPSSADVVLLFVRDHANLQAQLADTLSALQATSILWVAYPKVSSTLATDLSRDRLRAIAPDFGFKVVSQIAIDDDWSALRWKAVV